MIRSNVVGVYNCMNSLFGNAPNEIKKDRGEDTVQQIVY
jgi:hypothetical protein